MDKKTKKILLSTLFIGFFVFNFSYAQETGTGSLPTNGDYPTFYIDKPNSVLYSPDECLASSNDRGDMWCNSGLNYQTATWWDKTYTLDRIAIQMCWNTSPSTETRAFWEQGHAVMNGYDSYNRIAFSLVDNHNFSPQFSTGFSTYANTYAEIENPHSIPNCDGEIEFTDVATVIYKLNQPLTVFSYQTLYTRFTATYYAYYIPYGETVFSGSPQKGYLTNDFGIYNNSWVAPKFVMNPLSVTELSPKLQQSFGYCSAGGCNGLDTLGQLANSDKWGNYYYMVNNDINGLRYFQYLNFMGSTTVYSFEDYLVGAVSTTTPEYPTTDTYDCGITSGAEILGCIKNAFIWAFVPEKEVFDDFISLKDEIIKKPPMGYVKSIYDTFSFSTTTTPVSMEFMATSSPFYTYIFQPLRVFLVIIMYIFGAVWFFRRAKDIKV